MRLLNELKTFQKYLNDSSENPDLSDVQSKVDDLIYALDGHPGLTMLSQMIWNALENLKEEGADRLEDVERVVIRSVLSRVLEDDPYRLSFRGAKSYKESFTKVGMKTAFPS